MRPFLIRAMSNGLHVAALFSLLACGAAGCVSVRTIPSIARAGDTVSVMLAGSEQARKETASVTLTDSSLTTYTLTYPPTSGNGGIRSVFNVRADGTAAGLHYWGYSKTFLHWIYGHEPLQTVLVLDLPDGLAAGMASLEVDPNVTDSSAGVSYPATIELEIIPGQGTADAFDHVDLLAPGGISPAIMPGLEPAPYGKITFGGTELIGAASLVLDFDENEVPPLGLNLYVPQSTVQGGFNNVAFADLQRMVYWHQDGQQLYVDIVCPQGIDPQYLIVYVLHPLPGLSTSPFALVSSTVYDTVGGVMTSVIPTLNYRP